MATPLHSWPTPLVILADSGWGSKALLGLCLIKVGAGQVAAGQQPFAGYLLLSLPSTGDASSNQQDVS